MRGPFLTTSLKAFSIAGLYSLGMLVPMVSSLNSQFWLFAGSRMSVNVGSMKPMTLAN